MDCTLRTLTLVLIAGCTASTPEETGTAPPGPQAARHKTIAVQPAPTPEPPPAPPPPSEAEAAIGAQPVLAGAERIPFTSGGSLKMTFRTPGGPVEATTTQVVGTVEMFESDLAKTRINLSGGLYAVTAGSDELTEAFKSPQFFDARRYTNVVIATNGTRFVGGTLTLSVLVSIQSRGQRVDLTGPIEVTPTTVRFAGTARLSRRALGLPDFSTPGGALEDAFNLRVELTAIRHRYDPR